ncbi:MAG: cupredoxin domain-containing protein [Candidatus Doudnabacteria bacterium]|nr:cupredoxin domain-containing protein [Candidatus Doudnabacteria bacterium]
MNKYAIIVIAVVVLLVGGILFKNLKGQSDQVVQATGKEVNITIRAVKNEWRWDVTNVQVNAGDKINFTFINEDDYDHGIGIDGYGVNEKMPASQTVTRSVTATRKGKFNFYCSVPCGKGEVKGETRDHFDMIGTLEVI